MSFSDEITRQIMGAFKLLAVVIAKGLGMGIGAARSQYNNRQQHYRPKQLTQMKPGPLKAEGMACYTIQLPKGAKWDAEQAYRFINHLCGYGEICLQISATETGINWQIVNWLSLNPNELESAITSHYPGAVVDNQPYKPSASDTPFYRRVQGWGMGAIFPAPILTAEQIARFDPLAPLTQTLSDLEAGERVVLSLIVTGQTIEAAAKGHKLITQSNVSAFEYMNWDSALFAEVRRQRGYDQHSKYEHSLDKVMRQKLNTPLFHSLVMLQVDAATDQRTGELLDQAVSHLYGFANPPFNGLVTSPQDTLVRQQVRGSAQAFQSDTLGVLSKWLANEDDGWKNYVMVLTPQEMAAVWHLPHEGLTATPIRRVDATQVAASKDVASVQSGQLIGVNRYGTRETPILLPQESRKGHSAIIGKTETGKSSLLHQMIATDIKQGSGVCVIDPHGDLVSHILQHSIPSEREQDVVILDIASFSGDHFYPPPINILQTDSAMSDDVAATRLLSLFSRLYDDFKDRKMANTLNAVLLTLAAEDHATLMDIRRLFHNPAYREALIARVDDEVVETFWQDFEEMKEGQQKALIEPVLWRLRNFYNNKRLRAITCHPDPLPLKDWMGQNKIILVSLYADENLMPETERFILGAALVSQIEMAAMNRAINIKHAPYMLYIDEAQEFVTTSLPTMLSQVRKRGLSIVLANQYLRQLAGKTLDAVVGNVATLISFEVGEPDAKVMSTYMKPGFGTDELVALGKHRAAVSMRVGTKRQPAFSLETLPPPGQGTSNAGREASLRQRSIANYTPKSHDEVLAWLKQRRQSHQPAANTNGADSDDFFE